VEERPWVSYPLYRFRKRQHDPLTLRCPNRFGLRPNAFGHVPKKYVCGVQGWVSRDFENRGALCTSDLALLRVATRECDVYESFETLADCLGKFRPVVPSDEINLCPAMQFESYRVGEKHSARRVQRKERVAHGLYMADGRRSPRPIHQILCTLRLVIHVAHSSLSEATEPRTRLVAPTNFLPMMAEAMANEAAMLHAEESSAAAKRLAKQEHHL
jgi:hypothetical protein